ncbi:hypothetical protein PR048_003359 [Dryococelus australis]|uniref:Uncharacterized protein n=1 Tax=Dryococelus australis TaxID=614101 RepID=A0ABQ9IP73_9NEOP|nr:hypothetical protein PR048_003359 [Dryococelus australis]
MQASEYSILGNPCGCCQVPNKVVWHCVPTVLLLAVRAKRRSSRGTVLYLRHHAKKSEPYATAATTPLTTASQRSLLECTQQSAKSDSRRDLPEKYSDCNDTEECRAQLAFLLGPGARAARACLRPQVSPALGLEVEQVVLPRNSSLLETNGDRRFMKTGIRSGIAIGATLIHVPRAPSLLRARRSTGVQGFRCAACTYGTLMRGIVRLESRLQKSGGVTPQGIKFGSHWWEASSLTTIPPRPLRRTRIMGSHAYQCTPACRAKITCVTPALRRRLKLAPPRGIGIPTHPNSCLRPIRAGAAAQADACNAIALRGGRSGGVGRLLFSRLGGEGPPLGGVALGFSHVGIVLDDAACRRVFSGYSRFPTLALPAPLHPRVSFHVMSGDDGHLRVPAGKPVTRRVWPRPGFTPHSSGSSDHAEPLYLPEGFQWVSGSLWLRSSCPVAPLTPSNYQQWLQWPPHLSLATSKDKVVPPDSLWLPAGESSSPCSQAPAGFL